MRHVRVSRTGLIFLYLLNLWTCIEGASGSSSEPSHYLYDQGEASEPVIDYHPDAELDEELIMKPAFLFSPNNGPRMVEFYAYWCPHCRHFRDHYVQLARQVTTVAKEQGVQVSVYAVSCTEYHDICKHFGVQGYPKIKLFPANSTSEYANVNYWEAHPFEILNQLGVQTNRPLQFVTKSTHEKIKTDQAIVRRSKSDVFHDAYLSFHFALRNGIYMSVGPLSHATQDAFWDWLMLLQQSMPPTWEIHNLLRALVNNFTDVVGGEEHLLKVVERFPPPQNKWSEACSKGEKGMGYTCGLWELFHIITVGVTEWNLMVYDGEHLLMPVNDVSVTLRNYIEHFFGCEVCRMNFILSFDACAHDRCSRLHNKATTQREWKELPLWLFETHNAVNLRLMRERAEREKWTPTREDEVKAEWPARADCPKCWREDGGWHEDMVYKYLRVEYWLDDAIADAYRKELAVSDEADEIDEGGSFMPPVSLQLIPLIIVIGLGIGWYVKELERRKSGLHKRIA